MSSVADAQVDEDDDLEEAPGLWTSFGLALRLIVGWFCIAIGVLNLLAEVDLTTGEPDIAYFTFHAMLFVGGIALLSVTLMSRGPGVAGYVTGAVVAVAGMIAGSVRVSMDVCCMSGFDVRHGWPFTFLARDNSGPPAATSWHIDSQHLLADLLFWGYAGLLALVVVAMLRPRRKAEPEPPAATGKPAATVPVKLVGDPPPPEKKRAAAPADPDAVSAKLVGEPPPIAHAEARAMAEELEPRTGAETPKKS